MSYQRCATPGPFNLEVVKKTWSVSLSSIVPLRGATAIRTHSRRTDSIYFPGIGIGSLQRDGWTDKWMYAVRTGASLERPRRGGVKDSLALSLRMRRSEEASIFFCPFFFASFSPPSFVPSSPFSSLSARLRSAVAPSTLEISHSLSLSFSPRRVWKYTFIFEESRRPTGRVAY